MSAHEHYLKILLTKRELAHVYRQLFYAAQIKIQQTLPGCEPHDQFLTQVQNIINKRIEDTFERAKYALIVDGMDMANDDTSISELFAIRPNEEVVPFDTAMNQQLRDLIEHVERETTEVTRLRRELPQQARAAYEQLVADTDAQVTEIVKAIENGEDQTGVHIKDAVNGAEAEDDKFKEIEIALENGRSPVPNAEAIKERLLASIDNLYAYKNELPLLGSEIRSLAETVDVLMQIYEKLRKELQVYV
ncbi:hypothetical protein HF325_006034 [Metschnikowia pulcherrima]|uniref:Uncharacterized protein n=1 Tax=Metschnikowia pulcherrima TaxID=27326 RepID=A0A8H7GLN8_9ASCO|nr:hypothetical protein HF325_006034 [Metschnikowia pulcherrima]